MNELHIEKIKSLREKISVSLNLLFKFDVRKSIEKINQRQVIITTGKDTNHKNKIGFILWPENSKVEFYKTDKL